jgi:hypothetical protein
MDFRLRVQLAEAMGPVNRWYCSQVHGRAVGDQDDGDRELLVRYFVNSGGAVDFARRYEEAMSPPNRWYCSQFYRRDVRDEATLWEYYMRMREMPRGVA